MQMLRGNSYGRKRFCKKVISTIEILLKVYVQFVQRKSKQNVKSERKNRISMLRIDKQASDDPYDLQLGAQNKNTT